MNLRHLPRLFVKLLPIIVVVALMAFFGNTEWFSKDLHNQIVEHLKAGAAQLMPILMNLGIAFIVVYAGYLVFKPMRCGVERCLTSAAAAGFSNRGKRFWILLFQAAFWMVLATIAARIIAPTFVDNIVVGGSIIMGVLVLAAQDMVKNIIASLSLHTMPKCQEGEYVKVVGTDAEGEIVKIDYLSTHIKLKGEGLRMIVLPNSTVWNNAVIVGKPAKEEKKNPTCCKCCTCPAHKADEQRLSCCNGNVFCNTATHGCSCQNAACAAATAPGADAAATTSGAAAPAPEPRSANADAADAESRGPRSANADAGDPAQK